MKAIFCFCLCATLSSLLFAQLTTLPSNRNKGFRIKNGVAGASDTILLPYYKTMGSSPILEPGKFGIKKGNNAIRDPNFGDVFFNTTIVSSISVADYDTLVINTTVKNTTEKEKIGKLKVGDVDYIVKQDFFLIEVLNSKKEKINSFDTIILDNMCNASEKFYIRTNSIISRLRNQFEEFREPFRVYRTDCSQSSSGIISDLKVDVFMVSLPTLTDSFQDVEYEIYSHQTNYSKTTQEGYICIIPTTNTFTNKSIFAIQKKSEYNISPAEGIAFSNTRGNNKIISITSNAPYIISKDIAVDWLDISNTNTFPNETSPIAVRTLTEHASFSRFPRYSNLIITSNPQGCTNSVYVADTLRNYFKQEASPFYLNAVPEQTLLGHFVGSFDTVFINTNITNWIVKPEPESDTTWLAPIVTIQEIDSSRGAIIFKTISSNKGNIEIKKARYKIYDLNADITPVFVNVYQSNSPQFLINTLAINTIWVQSSALTIGYTARVFDQNGMVVSSSNLVDKDTLLDVRDLPPGIYLLYIYNAHGEIIDTQKFIKS